MNDTEERELNGPMEGDQEGGPFELARTTTGYAILDDGEVETVGDVNVIDFTWIRRSPGDYTISDLRNIQDSFEGLEGGQPYIEELDGIIQRKVDEGEVEE